MAIQVLRIRRRSRTLQSSYNLSESNLLQLTLAVDRVLAFPTISITNRIDLEPIEGALDHIDMKIVLPSKRPGGCVAIRELSQVIQLYQAGGPLIPRGTRLEELQLYAPRNAVDVHTCNR